MHGRRIFLFATREDLIDLFAAADPGGLWKYVDARSLWVDQRPRREWGSLREVRGMGRPRTGRKFASAQIFVVSRRVKVRERKILVYGRRWRWAVDSLMNPGAALMDPPGVYEARRGSRGREGWGGGEALIGGTSSTHRSTPAADRIIRELRNALRRGRWPRTGLFWFGPRALALARAGWRCTEDVTSPRNYDVVPPRSQAHATATSGRRPESPQPGAERSAAPGIAPPGGKPDLRRLAEGPG